MAAAYYNEIEPFAADVLERLISAGLIAPGYVDRRSIEDVRPDDLLGFTQCHFFAGVGVWSYALRRAGWPDDRRVWTGSCPCQPFSTAGKGSGFADERHLWPHFHYLIQQCRPPVVFGEQVASKDGLAWLDLVHADLEAASYTVGAADMCAAGVGAPHIRQRLYWVANANGWNTSAEREQRSGQQRQQSQDGGVGGVADSGRAGPPEQFRRRVEPEGPAAHGGLDGPGPTNGHWRDADWIFCRDGKWRPVEPGTFPLAHGAPSRVGRLRGYGNAIVAQVAQTFVEAYLETQASER